MSPAVAPPHPPVSVRGGDASPSAARTRDGGRLAALAVFALAAVLRLVQLGRTPTDPFYDAAVRSMGGSWHNLLVGAFDPSARLAIDKSPIDLWLQVATTKLLGFTPFALLLPAAIGGTLAVVALYDLLRTLAGSRVALGGALALAVLPVSVITSRSDTMDSVMAALIVAALAVAARGLRDGRTRHIVLAGALVGLAFEVKLFEALIAAVPLTILWWLGAAASRRQRAAGLAAAAAACVVVSLAWLVVMTVFVPSSARPWAFGSTNGSAWRATFIYDGWERLTGASPPPAPAAPRPDMSTPAARARLAKAHRRTVAAHQVAALRSPASPGPLRLLSSQAHLGARIGIALLGAWLAVLLVLCTRAWRRVGRPGRAGLAALAAWLALGTLLFSLQSSMRPRYLEAFDPAVAACLGGGLLLGAQALAGRARFAAPAVAGLLATVLTACLVVSAGAVSSHVQDSGRPGALPEARLSTLTAYLRAHQGGARYEVASVAVSKAGPIIATDGRPVLMLTGSWGHPLVSTGQLARMVAHGQVREALVGDSCTSTSPDRWAGCSAAARWIRAHGVDVSAAAGQPHAGLVYALGAARR